MRSVTKIVLAFVALASLYSQQPGWELTGMVTYNGRPVKGAWINADGPSPIKPVSTDGQGRFTVKGNLPGPYRVIAFMDEEPQERTARSLTMMSGGHLKVDLAIPKGAALSGRVVDRDKRPVPGVFVSAVSKSLDPFSVVRLGPQGEDRTNDLGEYRIAHLPPGVYFVSVTTKPRKLQRTTSQAEQPPGSDYPIQTFYPGAKFEGAASLTLHAGEEMPAIDVLVLKQPSHCLSFSLASGYYSDSTEGRPETHIHLDPWLGPSVVEYGNNLDGDPRPGEETRVCGLVAGDYRLSLLGASTTKTGPYVGIMHVLNYLAVPLTIKQENVDLGRLEIPEGRELRGTVSVEAAPASLPPGIQIRLLSTESQMLVSFDDGGIAKLAPDGSFRIPRVYPGDYAVRIGDLPRGYYVIDATQQGKSVRYGGLRAGNGELAIKLGSDGPAVSGRVLAADDSAVPDATVLLVSKSSGRPLIAHSDQSGTFQFTGGAAPGDYRIVATLDLSPSMEQDLVTAARLAASGTEVTLGSRQTKTIDLRLAFM